MLQLAVPWATPQHAATNLQVRAVSLAIFTSNRRGRESERVRETAECVRESAGKAAATVDCSDCVSQCDPRQSGSRGIKYRYPPIRPAVWADLLLPLEDSARGMGQGQSSVPAAELAALVELFDALRGEHWRRRDGWKQPTHDPETWFGVQVLHGHVVALELPANELTGEDVSVPTYGDMGMLTVTVVVVGCIPPTIERLTHLRVLDLSKNKLQGES